MGDGVRVRLAAETTVTTTMERRKFVIGAGALATGSAAALGTGAFSSVEAERSVEIDVEGDAEAYLRLTGDEEFIDDDTPQDSELEFAFGVNEETEEGGQGFNDDAVTVVEDIVTIENQGTEDTVQVDFGEDGDNDDEVTVNLDDADVKLMLPEDVSDRTIDVGNSTTIDIEVDTRDPEGSDSEEDITLYAEAQ